MLLHTVSASPETLRLCLSQGCNLDEGQCSSIYLLWEVIRDNSAERFSRHETIDIDNESYRAFVGILENRGMTAEEKYAELTK